MVCCCACGFSKSVDHHNIPISYHSFPTNVFQREVWKKFVARDYWEATKSSRLCSQHFSEESFSKSGNKVILKPSAIPTISIERLRYIRTISKKHRTEQHCQKSVSSNDVNVSVSNCQLDVNDNLRTNQSITSSEPAADSSIDASGIQLTTSTDDSPEVMNLKRQLSEAYLNRKLQENRMKMLMQRNRRQEKRLQKIKTLLNDMKSQSMINTETEQVLRNKFSDKETLFRTLFSLKRRRQCNEDIREFAVTLYYLSPKAYNYVRGIFENILPHPKTLSRWFRTTDANSALTTVTEEEFPQKCLQQRKLPR